jgi:predicted lipoprotein
LCARLQGGATFGPEGVGDPGLNHKLLRELFRNLQAFEALFETEGIDRLVGPDGREYCLQDIQYLYACRTQLSRRQRQAIELFLYSNIREKDVAKMMDVSETNPIAI